MPVIFLTGPARGVNGSCLLILASSSPPRAISVTVTLNLSQQQWNTLSSALEESIGHAQDDATEALKKHSLTRARKRRMDAEEYRNLRDALDIQYVHGREV